MPESARLMVRDTPVELLRDGTGPPFREDAHVDETAGVGR